jgi:hypothetical protein
MQGQPGPMGPPGPRGEIGHPGLQGEAGINGRDGRDGRYISVMGAYPNESDLREEHPVGQPNDAYTVNGALFLWAENIGDWVDSGPMVVMNDVGIPVFKVDARGHLLIFMSSQSNMGKRFRINKTNGHLEYVIDW